MTVQTDITVLLVAAFATWHVIEIWHHSSLFSSLRARVDLMDSFLGDMFRCPFCLAPWVALPMLIMASNELAFVPMLFAVARLANLFNDVAHEVCRTPKHDKLEELDLPTDPGDDDFGEDEIDSEAD